MCLCLLVYVRRFLFAYETWISREPLASGGQGRPGGAWLVTRAMRDSRATTQIWETSESTQIVSKYVGCAEL